MKKLVAPLSLVLTLASTHALASSTEVTLTGTLTPSACTPTLGNGGLVDYGGVSIEELEAHDDHYKLPDKQLSLTIQCASETSYALITTDNRHESSSSSTFSHGLGMHKGQQVGALAIGLSDPELDGTPSKVLVSYNAGQTWFAGLFLYFSPSQKSPATRVAFGAQTMPVPATRLSANLDITSMISNTLPFNEEIPIDGSVTFNIMYL
ncbi:DUF1120 domain-containing protein [Pseudomonas sp. GD03860]|uniref:DUF1120 domain-containing protein n=1 Tax=Pseudomonas TaxID=286 RepID=UPI0023648C7E|nr:MULTISPECIES: DUF1120 domain-containing protein [Pseudomonas]MDD2060846.1 DUF1120 domain-containing protein [Pseudomonas putida]MDH0638328.1 DUF1120 domain-containing protein [Pseudomonas sp. GD03860]